jgi:Lysozyme like domain/LysM domain
VKLRRTGKHARPSPAVEAAFRVAPKSARVALVAGTFIMPHPALARPAAAVPHSDTKPRPRPAVLTATKVTTSYTVRDGDTLWSISQRFYGTPWKWEQIWATNRSVIGDNPNEIQPGMALSILGDPSSPARQAPSVSASSVSARSAIVPSGTLSCSGLEELWQDAGGAPAEAFTAAEVALAESSGEQYATDHDGNGTTDEGYWQINTVNGDATYDALGNAKAAVSISEDGTNWSPWVTYQTGTYEGQC